MDLIKVKMPLWMRMQNFAFLSDGSIWWTTSSRSIIDKIKDLINPQPHKLNHTSWGVDIAGHQQYFYEDGFLTHDDGRTKHKYSEAGELVDIVKGDKLSKHRMYQLEGVDVSKPNQGLDYFDGKLVTAWGATGKDDIDVYYHNEDTKKLMTSENVAYKKFSKWYYKNWEAEGIRTKDGFVYVGVCFTSYFLTKHNFIIRL